jgi:hypothetical protein
MGMGEGFPDACKTQVGPAVVPIPYPNIVNYANCDPSLLATSVLICGFPGATMSTSVMMSKGDEAGQLGGVVSGADMGPSKPLLGSFSVLLQGVPADHSGNLLSMNGKPVMNSVGYTTAAGGMTVFVSPL